MKNQTESREDRTSCEPNADITNKTPDQRNIARKIILLKSKNQRPARARMQWRALPLVIVGLGMLRTKLLSVAVRYNLVSLTAQFSDKKIVPRGITSIFCFQRKLVCIDTQIVNFKPEKKCNNAFIQHSKSLVVDKPYKSLK